MPTPKCTLQRMSGDDLHSLPIFVYQVKCFAPVQNKDLAWGTKTTSSCKESNLSVCSGQSYINVLIWDP